MSPLPRRPQNNMKLYHNAEGKSYSLSIEPATDMVDIEPCILEEVAIAIKELKKQ